MRSLPECPHDWHYINQPDFPPEVPWVRMCGICLAIDGAHLAHQLDAMRNAVTRAEELAEAAAEYARGLHAWANELVAS